MVMVTHSSGFLRNHLVKTPWDICKKQKMYTNVHQGYQINSYTTDDREC